MEWPVKLYISCLAQEHCCEAGAIERERASKREESEREWECYESGGRRVNQLIVVFTADRFTLTASELFSTSSLSITALRAHITCNNLSTWLSVVSL